MAEYQNIFTRVQVTAPPYPGVPLPDDGSIGGRDGKGFLAHLVGKFGDAEADKRSQGTVRDDDGVDRLGPGKYISCSPPPQTQNAADDECGVSTAIWLSRRPSGHAPTFLRSGRAPFKQVNP